jgi:hypothetical protein
MTARGGDTVRVKRPRAGAHYVSLSWRVFAVNAVVLVLSGAVAVVIFSPGTISSPVVTKELLIVVAGLLVMLAVNRLLLARSCAGARDGGHAPRRPARARAARAGARAPMEASDLAVAFNAMAERLEDERRDSTWRALRAQEGERSRIARAARRGRPAAHRAAGAADPRSTPRRTRPRAGPGGSARARARVA